MWLHLLQLLCIYFCHLLITDLCILWQQPKSCGCVCLYSIQLILHRYIVLLFSLIAGLVPVYVWEPVFADTGTLNEYVMSNFTLFTLKGLF